MKIGMSEINECIYEAAEKKLIQSLEKQGFRVTLGNGEEKYDIYAEKGNDRRIYELKIGENRIQKRSIERLQEIAKRKRARLFITYLTRPKTSQIEFEGIDLMLQEYLIENMPDELAALSAHTEIENISDVDISSIKILNKHIKVEGNARIDVLLLYDSHNDRRSGHGEEFSDSFEFYFRATVSFGMINDAYFKFDLEHFYE